MGTYSYGVYYSGDSGDSWTASSGDDVQVNDMVYIASQDRWYCTGYSNNLAYSDDNGSSWTAAADPGLGAVDWLACCNSNGVLVVVGSTYVITTSDGLSWDTYDISSSSLQGCAYSTASGRTIVVGSYGYNYYSDDLVNWSEGIRPETGEFWYDVTNTGDAYIASLQNGSVAVSKYGTNWIIKYINSDDNSLTRTASGDGGCLINDIDNGSVVRYINGELVAVTGLDDWGTWGGFAYDPDNNVWLCSDDTDIFRMTFSYDTSTSFRVLDRYLDALSPNSYIYAGE
jgi:hypothetical protein